MNHEVYGLIQLLFLVVVVVGAVLYAAWNKRQLAKDPVDASLILTAYIVGVKLEKISSGKLKDYPYELMMTEPIMPNFDDSQLYASSSSAGGVLGVAAGEVAAMHEAEARAGKILLSLQLPVASPVHIIGISTQDKYIAGSMADEDFRALMEPIELEGDFPDYFKVYCDKAHKLELLQVLDPATMQFLVEYCQHEQWELFGNTLYFAQREQGQANTQLTQGENASMVQDAELFVERALPTLQRMNSPS